MNPPLYIVDAFTHGPFTGNPAAVCVIDQPATDAWMQSVASEMNLSETAFLSCENKPSESRESCTWGLRWFTPAAEVELCGHATLASAHVLWATSRANRDTPIDFVTRFRGTLGCSLQKDDRIAMNFPADPAEVAPPPSDLLQSLGLHQGVADAARSRDDWLVELHSAQAVRELAPDFSALAAIDGRGVMVTAAGDTPGVDVVSRFFAPRLGIDEDPVTGSAHCVLGPWWAKRLGRDTLQCEQLSARGGRIGVQISGDRVELTGRANTVMQGEWTGGTEQRAYQKTELP